MNTDRLPSAACAPGIEAAFVTPAELQARVRAGQSLLGEIHFGEALAGAAPGHPRARVGMGQFNSPPRIEAWFSAQPVRYGQRGAIRYAHNEQALFGCVALSEVTPARFETTVHDCYREILRLVDAERYSHLLRMWNYFPAIHAVFSDLDRYQSFCRGRFESLEEYYENQFDQRLPAASAVGTQDGDLVIYFIAAKTPGEHCENPRQMSAYRYPPQYGPRSPSFARATLKRWDGADDLYISGTASIVGHESLHADDARAQLDETLQNIRALIDRSAHDHGIVFRGLDSLTHVKVYVRRAEHFETVQRHLDAVLGAGVERLYLHADICRAELLMEIEAIARAR